MLGAVVGVSIVALLAGGAPIVGFSARLLAGARAEHDLSRFYRVPASATTGQPGRVIAVERVAAPPPGSRAWRVLYESTDENGTPTVVSGTIIAPAAAAPAASRTIVAWGHPTSGIAPRCAPSVGIDPFFFIEGLRDLLKAGYVVAATDYSGMGLPGPPSFLLGDVEGANMLDIARAARSLGMADAGDRVVLWGHSQGGQAALFAAQRASVYAPELRVAGVAVAAPATNLGALLNSDIGDVSGVTIGAYAFTSYLQSYASQLPPDALESVLTPRAIAALPSMARLCLFGQNAALHTVARPLIGSFVADDPARDPVWGPLLTRNTPSSSRLSMPLFVAQGDKDTLVRPSITAAYVAAQRAAGTDVESHVYARATHATVALDAVPQLMAWMSRLG